jgi:hypothetical protein
MELINKILKLDSKRIIDSQFKIEKGVVSGFSIEVFEHETDSYTSYTYYDDEKNRDKDWELLCKIK